jgi:hypothetical protein
VPPHWPTDRVHIVVGAITDPAAVDDAVRRGQAVISTLGPDMSRKATGLPLVEGTRLIVTAMQRHQIQRFIGMATPSVLDPRDRRTLQPRVSTLLARTFLPRAYDEIVGMSKIIMSSDRTWTIVRFLAPRDGAARRHVRSGFFGTDRIGWTITRADIAQFLTGQLDDQRYLNAAPAVSN